MNTVSVIQSLTAQAAAYVVILNFSIAILDLLLWLINKFSHKEDSFLGELFQRHKHYLVLIVQAISLFSLFAKTVCPILILSSEFLLWTVLVVEFVLLHIAAKQAYGSAPGKFFAILIEVCVLLNCVDIALLLPNTA